MAGYGREVTAGRRYTPWTRANARKRKEMQEKVRVSHRFLGGLRGRDCPSQPSQRPPRPPQGVPNRPARARPQIPWAAAADAPPPESAHRSRKSPKTENVPTREDVPKDPTGCPRPSPRSPGRAQAARTFPAFSARLRDSRGRQLGADSLRVTIVTLKEFAPG